VFGNAGGGKSTLARRVAAATRLPLYGIDRIQDREWLVEVEADCVSQHE